MLLRDHFRPPLADRTSWDGLYGGWPAMIVVGLNAKLPQRYLGAPRICLRTSDETDLATWEDDEPILLWSPPRPTFDITTEPPNQDESEVRVHDTQHHRRLVAAVEIVSPTNKARPEHRRAFVARCAALLQQRVSVTIIDVVTTRQFNLYADLLDLIGQADPALAPEPPATYAVACRCARGDKSWRLEAWAHALVVGQPLPTLPLWLADDLAVPLELEASYEETCRVLRIL
jgi:hypothetical protein